MSGDDLEPSTLEDVLEARLGRLRGARAWSSSGPVKEAAAAKVAGFDPLGQVFAATVVHFGYVASRARCSGSWSYTPRTDRASAGGPFSLLLRRLYGARRLVLARAVAECEALGGDGVIGAHLESAPHPAGGTAITIEGIAVRARSSVRPGAPFTAHVSGKDLVNLLNAGWMPSSLVFGISIASRHEDNRVRQEAFPGFGANANREIHGYSQLVNDARRDARDQLSAAIREGGGEGVVVDGMTLTMSERECPTNEGEHDRVAQASFVGTAITSFAARRAAEQRPPLTIMRLNAHPEKTTESGQDREPESGPLKAGLTEPEAESSLSDRLAAQWSARQRRQDPFRSGNSD